MFLLSNKILILFLMVTCYLFRGCLSWACGCWAAAGTFLCVFLFVFLCCDSVFHQASKTTLISCNYLDSGLDLIYIKSVTVGKCWQFSQSVVFVPHYMWFEWKRFLLLTFNPRSSSTWSFQEWGELLICVVISVPSHHFWDWFSKVHIWSNYMMWLWIWKPDDKQNVDERILSTP